MNGNLQSLAVLIGRVLLALIFVLSGLNKIGGFDGTVGYIASVGLPAPQLLAAGAILVEVLAGLALMVGFQARWAALALAVFTLLASFLFHNYWALPAGQQMMQMLMFMKNVSITGGLLVVAAFGAGLWSLDARRPAA